MLDQDKILDFLKATGPTLPSRVAKNMKTNILLASAYLADLVSQRKVNISNLKYGGSPLYYLSGQEDQLYQFAEGNMNPKDYQVLEELKNKKVLKENNLELLFKVALRSLKDFAVPLHVTLEGKKEIFWKWHLLSDEETKKVIGEIITDDQSKQFQEKLEVNTEETELISEQVSEQSSEQALEYKKKKLGLDNYESLQSESIELDGKQRRLIEEVNAEVIKTELSLEGVKVIKNEVEDLEELKHSNKKEGKEFLEKVESSVDEVSKKVEEPFPLEVKQRAKEFSEKNIKEAPEEIKKIKKVTRKKSGRQKVEEKEEKINEGLNKEELLIDQKIVQKRYKSQKTSFSDEFLPILNDYFKEAEIEVENHEVIRRNSEIDLLIKVPTIIGKMTYFCKAKKKMRCDEKDLSSAYMEAQIKKLPLLFLYTKDITKKTREMLDSGVFQNVVIKKVG